MKNLFFLFFYLIFLNSYAQQKFDTPPKFPSKNYGKTKKLFNYIDITDLKKNNNDLYCWKAGNNYHILDGITAVYSYYQYTDGDSFSVGTYTCAKGEFLNGKYQGIWIYYDKKGRIIKKEKWKNGKLIYRNEYSFNQCNFKEEYLLSNTPSTAKYKSIEQFKKVFFIKEGKLRCSNGVIDEMRMVYHNIDAYEFISIYKGLIKSHEINVKDAPVGMGNDAIQYGYDAEGNLDKITTVEKQQTFIKGNGHFIEYYTPIFIEKTQEYEPFVIKSEGEIKNNFKIGDWTYYNKTGEFVNTKTYLEKDSVDVRFPYSIFNKMK